MALHKTIPLQAQHMLEAAKLRRIALWHRLPGLRDVHSLHEDRDYWVTHLLRTCTILGAMVEDRLVGVIAYRQGWIEQLYVLPDFQCHGIGSLFIYRVQEAMDETRLWTFQRNAPARRFYERHGFAADKETDGSGNEEREPDILYHWHRPPDWTSHASSTAET
ncbi:GNAT family N-acetyltransferase [Rhizobium sp. 18055]|uniref:GNAT family N-acetyltransferase n=1 Tax=Rhizobium sp. 18055 TaxID=2681403 RepID=UPI00135A74A2|nr:GNAT family N-acetyltransferase [Rhizobium sp. 18055]